MIIDIMDDTVKNTVTSLVIKNNRISKQKNNWERKYKKVLQKRFFRK